MFLTRKEIFSISTWVLKLTVLLKLRKTYSQPCQKYWQLYVMHLMKDLGLLYEDMEVISATSASYKIMQNMCTTIISQVWRIDYITGQPTVLKFDKPMDAIKFICNHFQNLPVLQNLNVTEAGN